MKKLSLLFVFVLVLVAVLAFSASAKNITKEAEFSMASGGDFCQPEYVIDDNYHTGASNGNIQNWCDYYFEYETGRNITKIRVICNSVGENMGVCTFDSISNYSNGVICRVKNSKGEKLVDVTVQTSEAKVVCNADGKAIYSYIDFVPSDGTSWKDITWINIPALHSRQKETCLWEIDIFDDQECTDDTHEFQSGICGTAKVCNACGAESTEVSTTTHIWKAATCQPKTCAICCATEGEPAYAHTWVESTCARVRHCSVCDIDDENAEVIAHPDSAFIDTDTDCTTAVYCSVCGVATIPSKRHTFAEGSTKCINEGCTFNGKNIAAQADEIKDDFGRTYSNPKYLVDGNYFVGAGGAHNSHWINYDFIYNTEHNISTIFVVTNSSGNFPGDASFIYPNMTTNNNQMAVQAWDAAGNQVVNVFVNKYDLTKCVLYTDAAGKTYVGFTVDVDYKNISKVRLAVNCDYTYNHSGAWEIEIWEHSQCHYDEFVEQTLAPTCDTVGAATYKCACGNTTSKEVAALGHTWNAGEQTKDPTEDEDGTMLYTCTVAGCGDTKEEIIPALAHTHNYTTFTGEIVTAPGCATPGTGMYACRCGDEQEGEVAPTGNHNYTVYQSTIVDSTYLVEGTAIYKCNACDATAEGVLPRKSYNFAKYAVTVVNTSGLDANNIADGNYNTGSGTNTGYGSNVFALTFKEAYCFDKLVFVVNSVGGPYAEKTENTYKFSFTIYNGNSNVLVEYYDIAVDAVEMTGIDADGNEYKYDVVVVEFDNPVEGTNIEVEVQNEWGNRYLWEVETWGVTKNLHTEHNYTKLLQTIKEPTCAVAGTGLYRCDSCEETVEEELAATGNHTGGTATCAAKALCAVCNQEYGSKLDHTWSATLCTEQKVCSACGATAEGTAHTFADATCLSPKTCTVCGATEGEVLAHSLDDKKKCSICNNYVVATNAEFNSAYANAQEGDTILLTASFAIDKQKKIEKKITIDLGDNTITTVGWGGISLYNDCSLVNGTIKHTDAVAVIKAYAVDRLENLVIECTKTGTGSIITGIGVQKDNASTHVNTINNVTISGVGQGIEIHTGYVGTISNVTVNVDKAGNNADAKHVAGLVIVNDGKCGTISNSTFTGTTSAIRIESTDSIEFENCVLSGGIQSVYVNSNSPSLTFTETTFAGEGALINSNVAISGMTDVAVATIGTKYYATLEKAIAAATANETITLVKDIDLATAIVVNKAATINLNGKTITVTNDTVGDGVFHVVENGVLTINGEGTINGVGKNTYNIAIWADGGKVVINGGTYTNVGAGDDDHYDLIYVKNGGIVEINGGTFKAQTPKWTLNICDKTGGSFVVMGGTFQDGFNPGATETEPNSANNDFIPAGYYLNGNTVEECKSHELTELTCTENSVCTICQYVDAVATGHTMADATCTAPKTCTECGATEGEALGHNWDDATCTAPKTCTVCKVTEGTALGHQSDVPATCQNPATCKVCGQTFGNPDPNAHESVVTDAAVAATCTSTGLTAGSHCSACNTVIVAQQPIDKLDHTHIPSAVAPTCTEAGYTKYTCVCGDTYNEADESKPALGHKYNYGIGACERNCDDLVIVEVNDWKELYDALDEKKSVEFDVIKLKNSTVAKSENGTETYINVYAPVIIDLCGNDIEATGYGAFYIRNSECSLVNGSITKTQSGYQMLRLYAAKSVENVLLTNESTSDVTGILLYGDVGKLVDVTVIGARNNGIEFSTYYGNVKVDEMDRVKVSAVGQALNISGGSITTVKNCEFTGGGIGLLISNLTGDMALTNCKIDSGAIALVIENTSNDADFSFDSATKIITKGAIYDIKGNEIESLKKVVALVNGSLYSNLDEAIAALEASTEEVTEFTLMNDLKITESIVINKKVNFSLGGATYSIPIYGGGYKPAVTLSGYTITFVTDDNDKSNGVFHVVENGVLTLSGNGTVNATNASDYSMAIWADGGEVIINGGTYTNVGAGEDDQYDLIYAKNGGKVTINGGSFKSQTPKWTLNVKDNDGSTIVVNGGSFYMYNPTESASENPVVDFTSGKCAVKNSEGYYVVGEHQYFVACDKICMVCNKLSNPNAVHTIVHVDAVAGTDCQTLDGILEHWYCSDCGSAWLDEEFKLITNLKSVATVGAHTEETIPEVPATCTTAGSTAGVKCSVCNAVLTAPEAVKELGHTEETIPAVPATCTEAGSTAGVKCSVCNVVLTAPETVDATDHNWNSGTKIDGGIRYTCIACGEFKDVITRGTAVDPIKISLGENRFMYYTAEADAVYYYVQIAEAGTVTVEIDKYAGIKLGLNPELMGDTPFMSGSTSYTFEIQEAGNVVIAISLDYIEYTPPQAFTVSFEKKPVCEHTNTEVIPAVLPKPSNNHTGNTAGLYCLECETTIVAPQPIEITKVSGSGAPMRFRSASLTLQENISVNYALEVNGVFEEIYVIFVFLGEETEIITNYTINPENGRYEYKFLGVNPQTMQENIAAYAYGVTTDGEWVMNVRDSYSVQAYAEGMFGYNAKLDTVLSDLLVMGAKTQLYMNYKTDALVTDLVEANLNKKLTPSTFSSIDSSLNVQKLVGTKNEVTDWTGGTLELGSSTKMVLKFKTDSIENVEIKITIGDREETYTKEDFAYNASTDRYELVVSSITVLEFGTTVKGIILKDGEQIGREMNYSINSYLATSYSGTSTAAELVKALYLYGESVGAYFSK